MNKPRLYSSLPKGNDGAIQWKSQIMNGSIETSTIMFYPRKPFGMPLKLMDLDSSRM